MQLVEPLYLVTSGVLAVIGLAMVGMATRAYAKTNRRAMIHLSVGFTLIVGATIATAISAFQLGFEGTRSLLLVNNATTMVGFCFVIYSLVAYRTTDGQPA